MLAHPGYCLFIDAFEVAKCCKDYGTAFEINARKVHLTDDEWFSVSKTGVDLVINSDAHSPDKVGFIGDTEALIKRVGISKEQIVNVDGKIPNFKRFAEFKKKHL